MSKGQKRERKLPNRKSIVACICLAAALTVSGCSTGSEDKPKVPTPQQVRRVQIVDTAPGEVKRFSNLSATICRDNPIAPPPSRNAALQLLKTRAFMNGYLTLHSVEVGPVQGTLAHSCPGGVQAKGVGFTAK
jgi:hypothetical protein